MADLREQIVRALVATWEDPEQVPDALDYEAADAVLAVVEPEIRRREALALRAAADLVRDERRSEVRRLGPKECVSSDLLNNWIGGFKVAEKVIRARAAEIEAP